MVLHKPYYLNFSIWILGEWWKSDTEAIINEALTSGMAPNVSDAHTINGHPGPVQHCASQGEISINLTHSTLCTS
jgi:laccase